jgi:hypothetical protein
MCITSVDLNVTGLLLIIYSALIKYLRRKWELHQDRASPIDSVRRKVLYNTPLEIARLTNWCLNNTYRRGQVGKYLSDMLPIRYGLF